MTRLMVAQGEIGVIHPVKSPDITELVAHIFAVLHNREAIAVRYIPLATALDRNGMDRCPPQSWPNSANAGSGIPRQGC